MTKLHQTQSQHHADIALLLDHCFGPGRFARTAERLREGNQQIEAYARLYLQEDGQVGGSISYWPIRIGVTPALLLGPLAVHPTLQSKGVGLTLMRETLELIDYQRFKAVLLVGDLPYYQRVGFNVAGPAIHMPGPVDDQRLLVHVPDGQNAAQLAGMVRPAPDLC